MLVKKLRNLAIRLEGSPDPTRLIPEIEDWQLAMVRAVTPYTMTMPPALYTTIKAIEQTQRKGVRGDFVECGVWRGGNTIIAGLMRKRLGADYTVWAYDTYAGMTPPTEYDKKPGNTLDTKAKFDALAHSNHNDWCYASLEDVRMNYRRVVGNDDFRAIKGSVMETLSDPANLPDRIAVLRLDTDFYDSTKVELEVLWPRLVSGGVMVIDDYGEWAGARRAVDEYFGHDKPWLHYVDRSVRLVIKP